MNPCDEIISKMTDGLPEICTINDLIRAGIVNNRATMEYYRRKKLSPPYLRISSRRIYYPRNGIVKWLKEKSYVGEKKAQGESKITCFPGPPRMA